MIKYAAWKIKKHAIKNQLVVRTFFITCMDSFLDFIVYFQFKFLKAVAFLM